MPLVVFLDAARGAMIGLVFVLMGTLFLRACSRFSLRGGRYGVWMK